MLKKEFQYYLDNQKEIVAQYNNKFIVIVDSSIVGSYDSQTEAYNEATKSYKLGTFLIQKVTPGETAYTNTFHSRVILNQVG